MSFVLRLWGAKVRGCLDGWARWARWGEVMAAMVTRGRWDPGHPSILVSKLFGTMYLYVCHCASKGVNPPDLC